MLARWAIYLVSLIAGILLVGLLLVGFIIILAYPKLPDMTTLTDYQPKIPLRIYSAEGSLLGEFGEERRAVVKIQDVPVLMKQAILAAEDERFYQHGGVDYQGLLRAAYSDLVSRKLGQGASTITMQVARNFFLTREKTPTRKLNEILLAYKIEANLSKDQILELYMNQINLGRHAYGFGAAAQIYFGKSLRDINLAEAAMLATLPQAPSRNNPVANPERAKQRQHYVLRRMRDVNFINEAQYQQALQVPLHVQHEIRSSLAHADYVAEMARQVVFDTYGDDAYSKGIRVYTTVRLKDQEAAHAAVRRGVLEYDHRHGYRGPESFANLPTEPDALEDAIDAIFDEVQDSEDLQAAIVLEASPKQIKAEFADGTAVEIYADGLKFVQRALADKAPPNVRIRRGAVIRVQRDDKG